MKRINIYITHHEKDTLDRKCRYYHISLSTLAEKISTLLIEFGLENDLPKILELKKEYINKENNYKTSIKPQEKIIYADLLKSKSKSIWYSNVLKIYANNMVGDYLKKETDNFYKRIEEILKETKERFYNYNSYMRSFRRAVKENPEYFEKAIKHVKTENSRN